MIKLGLFLVAVQLPSIALACDGACKDHHEAEVKADAAPPADPGACAKNSDLVGGSCSYTTGSMAQRVLHDGTPWTFAGSLREAATPLDSHVAAPYAVGPDGVRVVANEVLDRLIGENAQAGRVNLEGRTLDVDGTRYFVLTGYSALNS